jgi:hypothetical protein
MGDSAPQERPVMVIGVPSIRVNWKPAMSSP